jgi:tyrosyl-DNA phosphodiesterase-1
MFIGAHNLSKPAWGEQQNTSKYGLLFNVKSFELGVLLVPSLELAYRKSRWYGFSCTDLTKNGAPMAGIDGTSEVSFVQWQRGQRQEASVASGKLTVPLPIPYELPPRRYADGDVPWDVETARAGLDALGVVWPGVGSHYGHLE